MNSGSAFSQPVTQGKWKLIDDQINLTFESETRVEKTVYNYMNYPSGTYLSMTNKQIYFMLKETVYGELSRLAKNNSRKMVLLLYL